MKGSKRKREETKDISPNHPSNKKQKGKLLDHSKHLDDVDGQVRFLTKWTEMKFASDQVVAPALTEQQNTFLERLQSIVSKKKLKQWNNKSPMIVIVCLSARRAVSILKELAPSKTRVAKLFAKHMSIEQQESMLQSSTFGIAVGTPHRLLALARGSKGAFSLQRTQYIVFDKHVNPKNYTVYTLPDTAPHAKEFLKDVVRPEMENRQDLRIAFL